MKLPALPYGVVAVGGLIEWLRVFVASVAAGWRVEHTAEGRHEWHWATPTFNANRVTGAGSLVWTVGSSDVLLERYAVMDDVGFELVPAVISPYVVRRLGE